MVKIDIAGKMNDYREYAKKSIAQMARDLETDPGTLGNVLRGTRGVPLDMVVRFCATYSDVSAEWLLRGSGEMIKINNTCGHIVTQNNVGDNTTVAGSSGMSENFVQSLLAEKDKQISQLLQIIATK